VSGNGLKKPFNLRRWFSIASLVALLPVAALTGFILSGFIADEVLQRDTLLTAQFIQNSVSVEGAHIDAATAGGLVRLLDPGTDSKDTGLSPPAIAAARTEVFEHLKALPDILLASVYARDGHVVWSTNKDLIGSYPAGKPELTKAFGSRVETAQRNAGNAPGHDEPRFVVQPRDLFIESYLPLTNPNGEVVLVAEVYKEPSRVMAVIRRGAVLVWSTTLAGGAVIYLGLFTIIQRASTLLARQQRQIREKESLVFAGEMATALAHGLRNPLASVRSSAELALATGDLPVRKNIQDIINRVDFLAKWVRDLLIYSRPLAGEAETVDLGAVLTSVLASFAPTLARAGIQLTWNRDEGWRPLVKANASLLTQALGSVVSNAVDAMPGGGELRIALLDMQQPPGVELLVSDTGVGMSRQELAAAFKPFHTTKTHGLGVGLPMIRRVMERFGGVVLISSAENAGTQVRLRFRT
jgi:signal transduction histidine kinase